MRAFLVCTPVIVRHLAFLVAAATLLATPAVRAQASTPEAAVPPPNPDGCTTPSSEVVQAAQTLLSVTSTKFDFRSIATIWPLTAQSPADRQLVCFALRGQMPREKPYRRGFFFESEDYYLGMTQIIDPDPTDDSFVFGTVTIAVFHKDLTKITAFSF